MRMILEYGTDEQEEARLAAQGPDLAGVVGAVLDLLDELDDDATLKAGAVAKWIREEIELRGLDRVAIEEAAVRAQYSPKDFESDGGQA